jgi:cytochrome b6-f complex iron-sulfur subunit
MDEHDDTGNEKFEGQVERREVLNWTWKVLAVGFAVEAAWTTYDILVPKPSGAFGGVVDAGPVVEFPEGTVRYFLNGRFYVISYGGSLYALYQKCTHLGCRVPYCDTSEMFECPCHGSVFNVLGEYIAGPAPRGMDRFPVTIEEGEVIVDTADLIEGPPKGMLTGPAVPAGPSCSGEGGSAGVMPDHADEQIGDAGHAGSSPEGSP